MYNLRQGVKRRERGHPKTDLRDISHGFLRLILDHAHLQK